MRLGLGIVVVALIASCSEETAVPPPGIKMPDASCREGSSTIDVENEEAPEIRCDRSGTSIVCAGDWAALCDGDRLVDRTNCRIEDEKCYERACDDARDCARCLTCKPNAVRCGDDGERERCNEDGSGYEPDEPCDESAGLYCDALSGRCSDLCAEAEAERSYIGCEYYAVSTSNAQLELEEVDADGLCQPFSFAIVVANGESVPARVTIETPDGALIERTIDPAQTEAIPLPCSLELTGMGEAQIDGDGGIVPRRSSAAVNGAHHITSNVPITVYQFNPLEFESGQGIYRKNSYTNDASLLLPVSSLTTNYMATTVPTLLHVLEIPEIDAQPRLIGPGFVTIVGVSEQPTDVEIRSTAHTLASDDDALPALAPGESAMITLERGEVAQILSAAPDDCDGEAFDDFVDHRRRYCEVSRDYDLTGTRIAASQPVLVLSGHDCTFVPFDRWACDHVEEVMQPLESWGKDIIVALTAQPECRDAQPNIVRVLASHDGTRVTLEPELHDPVTLDEGEVLQVETTEDLRVIADKGISVSQLLVGQDYDGRDTSSFAKGDPSLSLAIPAEQWRKRYSILTPETFTDNFVGIIAREDQVVLLDGRVVTQLKPVEGTPYVTAQLQIRDGQHTLESILPFGVTVYGYAPYTSYMVAGGLDLNLINPPQ
jgi:hypothetical protein